jgi:predicted ATP-binding protein involved in virulence
LYNNGETIELYPEDLSHGELKRLSIYIWLKSRNIEDAIVLMDEVEIAFHPDWQYQIISDLKEWAPSNQYILATHSYALCEALTPAHVKEIEPKLIKQESNITNES